MPTSFLVIPPVPKVRLLPIEIAPTPLMVRLTLEPVTPPERAKLPASALNRASVSIVMSPLTVLSPEILRSTPEVAEIPVPETVIGSGEEMPPCTSSAAPAETTVPPAFVPRAALF